MGGDEDGLTLGDPSNVSTLATEFGLGNAMGTEGGKKSISYRLGFHYPELNWTFAGHDGPFLKRLKGILKTMIVLRNSSGR